MIGLDDVLARAQIDAAAARAADRPAALAVPALAVPAGAIREPLRGPRRSMARSMTLSHAEVPLSNVCDDADIHAWPAHGGYMLRLMRALIRAAHAEPALNAWYDSADRSRILLKHIDLAIAVDTPQGLIVPVVRNIQDKSPGPAARRRRGTQGRGASAHPRRPRTSAVSP